MIKSIIKEIIIMLLLLFAVVLALGVLFYDYIPSNKIVPSVETYKISESIKNELNEQITEDETILVTYEITSGDLNSYEKQNQYDKGKANPFSTYKSEVPETNYTNDTNNVTNSNTSTNTSNTNVNSAKSKTFYNSTGTK